MSDLGNTSEVKTGAESAKKEEVDNSYDSALGTPSAQNDDEIKRNTGTDSKEDASSTERLPLAGLNIADPNVEQEQQLPADQTPPQDANQIVPPDIIQIPPRVERVFTVEVRPDENGELRSTLNLATQAEFDALVTEDSLVHNIFGLSHKFVYTNGQIDGKDGRLYHDIRDPAACPIGKDCPYKFPGVPCGCQLKNFVFAGFCSICWKDTMEKIKEGEKPNLTVKDIEKANGIYIGEQGDKNNLWQKHCTDERYPIIAHCLRSHSTEDIFIETEQAEKKHVKKGTFRYIPLYQGYEYLEMKKRFKVILQADVNRN